VLEVLNKIIKKQQEEEEKMNNSRGKKMK